MVCDDPFNNDDYFVAQRPWQHNLFSLTNTANRFHSLSTSSQHLPCSCVSMFVLQLTLALVAVILRAIVRMYVLQMLVMHQALFALLLCEFGEIDVFFLINNSVALTRDSHNPVL